MATNRIQAYDLMSQVGHVGTGFRLEPGEGAGQRTFVHLDREDWRPQPELDKLLAGTGMRGQEGLGQRLCIFFVPGGLFGCPQPSAGVGQQMVEGHGLRPDLTETGQGRFHDWRRRGHHEPVPACERFRCRRAAIGRLRLGFGRGGDMEASQLL